MNKLKVHLSTTIFFTKLIKLNILWSNLAHKFFDLLNPQIFIAHQNQVSNASWLRMGNLGKVKTVMSNRE